MASSISTKIVTAAVAAAVGLAGFSTAPTASAGVLDILGHGLSISAGEQSDYIPTSERIDLGAQNRSGGDPTRPTTATVNAHNSVWPTAQYEEVSLEIARIINEHRQAKGEPQMQLDAAMSRSAQAWAQEMATKNFFEHDYSTSMGEIIASRFNIDRPNTAEQFVRQWEESAPHAKLMHRSDMRVMGVGVAQNPETHEVFAVCRLYYR